LSLLAAQTGFEEFSMKIQTKDTNATSSRRCGLLAILLSLAVLCLSGCANPSITSIDKAAVAGNSPIYVARFEGKPEFVESATDMFIATLRQRTSRRIIQGDALREEPTDIAGEGNIAPRGAGLSAARASGAGLLVLGKVTSHKTDLMLNGFVTARLIDVRTGGVVGTVHRPSGLLLANSEHQCMMAAAKRAAQALGDQLQ
jgi:hypothetical protein